MTPKSFTFKLTAPRDSEVVAIVAEVANHASTYAELDETAVADFVKRVSEAVAKAFKYASGSHCQIVFSSSAAELKATVGGETVVLRRSS